MHLFRFYRLSGFHWLVGAFLRASPLVYFDSRKIFELKIAAFGALPNTALTFGTCAKISCKFLHKPSELLLEIRKCIKKKCSRKETLITGESNKALLKRRRVLVRFRILLSELPNYIKFQWWPLQILRHLLVNIADLTNVCNLKKCAKHNTFGY